MRKWMRTMAVVATLFTVGVTSSGCYTIAALEVTG